MNDKNHSEMMEVLRAMLRIQSLSAVRELATKKEKIMFLSEAGLMPKDIAPIVSSSSAAVSQTIYEFKKRQLKGEQNGEGTK